MSALSELSRDSLIRELVEALEPFANYARNFDTLTPGMPDDTRVLVEVGAFRRARTAVNKAKGK